MFNVPVQPIIGDVHEIFHSVSLVDVRDSAHIIVCSNFAAKRTIVDNNRIDARMQILQVDAVEFKLVT